MRFSRLRFLARASTRSSSDWLRRASRSTSCRASSRLAISGVPRPATESDVVPKPTSVPNARQTWSRSGVGPLGLAQRRGPALHDVGAGVGGRGGDHHVLLHAGELVEQQVDLAAVGGGQQRLAERDRVLALGLEDASADVAPGALDLTPLVAPVLVHPPDLHRGAEHLVRGLDRAPDPERREGVLMTQQSRLEEVAGTVLGSDVQVRLALTHGSDDDIRACPSGERRATWEKCPREVGETATRGGTNGCAFVPPQPCVRPTSRARRTTSPGTPASRDNGLRSGRPS